MEYSHPREDAAEPQTRPLRVAAYCRVSTRLEEQEGSYEMQVQYYTDRIRADPGMELAGIYGDNGKSGLKTRGREGLEQLLRDCEAGKIDLILTKSISRFARSMADCAELIRRLRELGVDILFEKEGINSQDPKCDLLLHIFAALAQEESNSISQNARRAHEQYVLEGRPFGRIAYGYCNAGQNQWAVREPEAERVRMAFQMAARGCCYREILEALNRMEQRDATGVVWKQKRLRRLLRSVVYKGDYYSHGTVCLVPGRPVANRGYRDRFYIEDHHLPLVSGALFDRVQEMLARGLLHSHRRLSTEENVFLQKEKSN